jgi:hypothetical protein
MVEHLSNHYNTKEFISLPILVNNASLLEWYKEAYLETLILRIRDNKVINITQALYIYCLVFGSSITKKPELLFSQRTHLFQQGMDTYFGKSLIKNWMINE